MTRVGEYLAAALPYAAEAAGGTVRYSRHGIYVDMITVAEEQDYKIADESGVPTDVGGAVINVANVHFRDFILRAADLVIDGKTITPRSGDKITETIQGNERTYEVMPAGQLGEASWLTADGSVLRVHTKYKTSAVAG
jgi:hypothetical protein